MLTPESGRCSSCHALHTPPWTAPPTVPPHCTPLRPPLYPQCAPTMPHTAPPSLHPPHHAPGEQGWHECAHSGTGVVPHSGLCTRRSRLRLSGRTELLLHSSRTLARNTVGTHTAPAPDQGWREPVAALSTSPSDVLILRGTQGSHRTPSVGPWGASLTVLEMSGVVHSHFLPTESESWRVCFPACLRAQGRRGPTPAHPSAGTVVSPALPHPCLTLLHSCFAPALPCSASPCPCRALPSPCSAPASPLPLPRPALALPCTLVWTALPSLMGEEELRL